MVAVEQKDNNGIDRVFLETVADSAGGFSFCPLPAGTYNVIVTAVNGAGAIDASTVITGSPEVGPLRLQVFLVTLPHGGMSCVEFFCSREWLC